MRLGLRYAAREEHLLKARDAHQQRADRAEALVAELLETARTLLGNIDTCRQVGKLKGGDVAGESELRAAIAKATQS